MLKLILSLFRDNEVYLSMDFTETEWAIVHAAIRAGFARVVNTRYILTAMGELYLENEYANP